MFVMAKPTALSIGMQTEEEEKKEEQPKQVVTTAEAGIGTGRLTCIFPLFKLIFYNALTHRSQLN